MKRMFMNKAAARPSEQSHSSSIGHETVHRRGLELRNVSVSITNFDKVTPGRIPLPDIDRDDRNILSQHRFCMRYHLHLKLSYSNTSEPKVPSMRTVRPAYVPEQSDRIVQ